VERFVPRDALPLPSAARSRALQRVEDAMRVLELVQRRRSLGAVPATRSGVLRVPLELSDLARFLVDVGEEPAGRLAVHARRLHEHGQRIAPPPPRAGTE